MPYQPVLCVLFSHEKEVSLASVLSLTGLIYQFNDQFLMVSGAWEAGATFYFWERKISHPISLMQEWKIDWGSHLLSIL